MTTAAATATQANRRELSLVAVCARYSATISRMTIARMLATSEEDDDRASERRA